MLSLFNCWNCCTDITRRNTSQRSPEPPQNRSDRLRAGRPAPTSSLRREKQALRPPMTVEGEVGARDLLELMMRGDHRPRRVYPRRWTWRSISRIIRCISSRKIRRIILRSLSLTSISVMRISCISMRISMSNLIFFEEAKLTPSNWHQRESNLRPWGGAHSQVSRQYEQPDIEEPQQQDGIEQHQQHDGGGRFQGVLRVVYEAVPDGYAGGPSDLTLLPRFGGHVACRIWVDADVSIF